jgi:hypothetical protein
MQNDRRPKQCTAQVQMNACVCEQDRGRKVIKHHRLDDPRRGAPNFAVSCSPTCDGKGNKRRSGNPRRNQTSSCVQRGAK